MQPTEKFRAGLVSAAIFEREVEGPNGTFKSQSIALQTSYKKDGEFVNKNLTIISGNLDNAIKVLTEARDSITAAAS